MENIRKNLIRWNVAPLIIVGLFCFFSYWILSVLLSIPPCGDTQISMTFMGTLLTAFTGSTAILYKMYGSLQKDRGDEDAE